MYYEEKIINGVMHYRTDPDKEFQPYTLEELSDRYDRLKREYSAYIANEKGK